MLSYTVGKLMERRFHKVKKLNTATTTYPAQKSVTDPKMTKNVCSLSMMVSNTVGKLMEKRFQKVKKVDSPRPKLVLGPKMTQNGFSLSMVPPLESQWKWDFEETKFFWPVPPTSCSTQKSVLEWLKMILSLKMSKITSFSNQLYLVTCCGRNSEDWSWAQFDEHDYFLNYPASTHAFLVGTITVEMPLVKVLWPLLFLLALNVRFMGNELFTVHIEDAIYTSVSSCRVLTLWYCLLLTLYLNLYFNQLFYISK